MIKEIEVNNWKSFQKLNYKFQSLNILLGNNSSGKSNFLDLLELISKVARGASNEEINKIRGGIDYFRKMGSDEEIEIMLTIEIKNTSDIVDIFFIENRFELMHRNDLFEEFKSNSQNKILKVEKNQIEIKKTLDYIEKKEKVLEKINEINKVLEKINEINKEIEEIKKMKTNTELLISEIESDKKVVEEYKNKIENYLKNINVLDPIPSLIRGTTKNESKELQKDCSNLISFVANLEEEKKKMIEEKLVEYLKRLTFSDVEEVSFKFLGENKEFSQLYIVENGIKLHSDIVSDGMLRFVAIIVALMTQKSGGILAIEEIDNGIAPYQLKMLMNIIDEVSFENKFDVVFTTHNHLLMNYIGEEYMDFVYYVSKKKSKSSIKRIKDYKSYGKISSHGRLGDLVDNVDIINMLNDEGESDEA